MKLIDPLKSIEEVLEAAGVPSAAPLSVSAQMASTAIPVHVVGDEKDPLKEDFRLFLTMIWHHLGLPTPSALQLNMAWWLQHGPRKKVILAFRGASKSWITGAFALWLLYCDPQKKVLVISASLDRAVQFVTWCLALIREVPQLKHLYPEPHQRSSARFFDVCGARPAQSPSMRAVGVTGQMAGSRADHIVVDDAEIPVNSATTEMRDKLETALQEVEAILVPGGRVDYLGTPQVEDSVYAKLPRKGYTLRIWPVRHPTPKQARKYGDALAPWLVKRLKDDPTLAGKSVWPQRFTDQDIAERELGYGRSGFLLQFMMDMSLSESDRYPLKLADLMCLALDSEKAPEEIIWGSDPALVHKDLPHMGFSGDFFHRPTVVGPSYARFERTIGWCDPSGRGSNETALAITSSLNGRIFARHIDGWKDGYGKETLEAICRACITYGVGELFVEDNFGDGMFLALLEPVMARMWKEHNAKLPPGKRSGTTVTGVKSPKHQKELRILNILEPASQQHRLVVDKKVVLEDQKVLDRTEVDENTRPQYSVFHQYTHLTRDNGSLKQDDRLEALAGAVSQYSDIIGTDPWEAMGKRREAALEDELEALFEEADDLQAPASGSAHKSRIWKPWRTAVRP